VAGQPPISSTGTRARYAFAIAVTVLVTPGPAVTMATPKPPVSSAWACAMCTAAPSSRTSTMRMPAPRHVIPDRLDVAALQAEHGRSMPRRSRKRAIQAAQLSGAAARSTAQACSLRFLSFFSLGTLPALLLPLQGRRSG